MTEPIEPIPDDHVNDVTHLVDIAYHAVSETVTAEVQCDVDGCPIVEHVQTMIDNDRMAFVDGRYRANVVDGALSSFTRVGARPIDRPREIGYSTPWWVLRWFDPFAGHVATSIGQGYTEGQALAEVTQAGRNHRPVGGSLEMAGPMSMQLAIVAQREDDEAMGLGRCVGCGCTQNAACSDGCSWARTGRTERGRWICTTCACRPCGGTGIGDPAEGWSYYGTTEPGSIPPCDACAGEGLAMGTLVGPVHQTHPVPAWWKRTAMRVLCGVGVRVDRAVRWLEMNP